MLELHRGTPAVWARKAWLSLAENQSEWKDHRPGISPDPAYFKLKPNAVVLTLGLQIDQPK